MNKKSIETIEIKLRQIFCFVLFCAVKHFVCLFKPNTGYRQHRNKIKWTNITQKREWIEKTAQTQRQLNWSSKENKTLKTSRSKELKNKVTHSPAMTTNLTRTLKKKNTNNTNKQMPIIVYPSNKNATNAKEITLSTCQRVRRDYFYADMHRQRHTHTLSYN